MIDISHVFRYYRNLQVTIATTVIQGGHKPGKPGKLREFEKLSKSQEKLREV